jgi:hypothetical protein
MPRNGFIETMDGSVHGLGCESGVCRERSNCTPRDAAIKRSESRKARAQLRPDRIAAASTRKKFCMLPASTGNAPVVHRFSTPTRGQLLLYS